MNKSVHKHRSLGWLTWLGFVSSFVILATAISLVIWLPEKVPAMGLNEWGDFIAGFASVIAIVWLIIGYFQQKEELRINSDEVARMASHTEKLASIQQQQLDALKESFDVSFRVDNFKDGPGRDYASLKVAIVNNAINDLDVYVDQIKCSYPDIDKQMTIQFSLPFEIIEKAIAPGSKGEFRHLIPLDQFHPDLGCEDDLAFYVHVISERGTKRTLKGKAIRQALEIVKP